jgi:glycosyltransferase involved in cell wall biosynthesis
VSDPLASIVIDNYNYERYLGSAIESALNQTYAQLEVIVVDDGSTDRSREIIAGYGHRIVPVLKDNGGQASAFNAGFRASHGDLVCFLDADDSLLPTAMERSIGRYAAADIAKVHWPLLIIDEQGVETGDRYPEQPLPAGDLRDALIRTGPTPYLNPPTSGNAWSRSFLNKVLPVPEDEFRLGADAYLLTLAPLYGPLASVTEPQGCYRIHASNHFWHLGFDAQLEFEIRTHSRLCHALSRHARLAGIDVPPEALQPSEWVRELQQARELIVSLVPPGDTFILVDDNTWWPGDIAGRHRLPFLERAGQYWGPPLDDAQAIHELERLRGSGAHFILFASPCFWWLDYYAGFRRHLEKCFRCILHRETLIAFDIR